MYDQEVQSHALVAEASSVCRAVVVEVDVEDVATKTMEPKFTNTGDRGRGLSHSRYVPIW